MAVSSTGGVERKSSPKASFKTDEGMDGYPLCRFLSQTYDTCPELLKGASLNDTSDIVPKLNLLISFSSMCLSSDRGQKHVASTSQCACFWGSTFHFLLRPSKWPSGPSTVIESGRRMVHHATLLEYATRSSL